jgi:hypothetical protein
MLASSSTLVRERNPVFVLQGYVTESQVIITTLLIDISWAFGFCVARSFLFSALIPNYGIRARSMHSMLVRLEHIAICGH